MTYAPKRLLELHEYLKDEAGLPANALGIVGNPKTHFGGCHCQGVAHREQQRSFRAAHGWKSEGIVYVFGTHNDTVQQAQVIRDQFRAVVAQAGIPGSWTPKELRNSFVSLMSDNGATLELIADLVGHANTTTTATVYRHQLRPVMTKGADLLDEAFAKGLLDDPET